MNKENAVDGDGDGDGAGLSAEQRARISQKFRSAKALLERKRPRLSLSGSRPFPSENAESPARVNSFRRIPLAEIPTNSINIGLVEDVIPDVHSIRKPETNRIIRNEGASASIPISSRSISLGRDAIHEVHSVRQPENNRIIRNEGVSASIPISSRSISLGKDTIPAVHSIPKPENNRIIRNDGVSASIPISSRSISLGRDAIPEVHSVCQPENNRIIRNEGVSASIPITSKSISLGRDAILEVHSVCQVENKKVIRNEDASFFIPMDSTSISLGEDSIPEVHSICEPEHDGMIMNEDESFFIPLNSINIGLDEDLIPEVHSICVPENNKITGIQDASLFIPMNSRSISLGGNTVPEVHSRCGAENNRIIGNEDASILRPHVTPIELEERHNLNNVAEPGVGDNGNISFSTPVMQHSNVGFRDSLESSAVTVLDDCFDDAILEEIDAICEKSAAQSARAVPNNTFVETLPIDWKTEEGNGIASLMDAIEKAEGTVDNPIGDQVGGSRNSLAVLPDCMPEEYSKYMKSLNERQQDAACSDISIPLMIIAGPGSGKTSTMVGRILMLLSQGISPSNILAMTFTTAAAAEMRERIGSVAGKASAKELTISTFHSFSLQLCRLHAEKLGRTTEFSIYGHGQQRRAVIEAARLVEDGKTKLNEKSEEIEGSGVTSPHHFKDKSKKWLKFVTQAKASGKTPEDYDKMGNETGAVILRNYNDILKSCNALDYHDLISCSVRLLNDYPEVFEYSQETWKAIVIDEFQDTSSMQYSLLHSLASHKRITIVGDEDQSIFSFNGADVSGFDSFRNDFPMHKEVKLNRNYRSTRYIVEAANSLIRNNLKRCQSKDVLTGNACGYKLTVKECSNENSQCAFVVDKICELVSENSSEKCTLDNIAVLYRRQVSGRIFQATFRSRKIPFNNHGVAFYRKKVVRAIISMLRTALPSCDDGDSRRVYKALLPLEKEEKKKMIDHIDKVTTVRKCSFISAATDIFSAKISGTFKRAQLTQGKKVLVTIDMIKKLVHREQSISAVISSVANMVPQKYLLEQRAVVDNDAGKYLNEDNDLRSVLEFLLDDVSDFLTNQHNYAEKEGDKVEGKGCSDILKAFIDIISDRERENFQSRKHDNKNSVTLTTIHQSKGLEWDVVFIVKVNESEIPLLHDFDGGTHGNGALLEEERRLLYVGMTRAKKRLFVLYLKMDSNWQVLQPSRFLREIPHHLIEIQEETRSEQGLQSNNEQFPQETCQKTVKTPGKTERMEQDTLPNDLGDHSGDEMSKNSIDIAGAYNATEFLRRFSIDERSVVSQLFHKWAKKPAFQDPKRLLDKVMFVIDERLRAKKNNHRDVLRTLRSCLSSDEAKEYAISVLKWEQIPADQRAHIVREKQEHFQKQRIESAMGSSSPTPKQIAYLQSLGCTVTPTSRLHASRLIEQYKAL